MSGSINIDNIAGVTPSVLAPAGNAIDLIGVALTPNLRCPVGQAPGFSLLADVGSYFGLSSDEYLAAQSYFPGFTNSNKRPGQLLFMQYNTAAVSAYLRGASQVGISLTTLKTYSGMLSVPVDGVAKTSGSAISLSAATSFSNAATIIGTAISAAVSFDAISQSFVVTSATTGTSSTVDFATGSLASLLGLDSLSASQKSLGSAAQTPSSIMAALLLITRNWASFTTLIEPDISDKLAFSAWNSSQNKKYCYVPWDTDGQAVTPNSTTNFGYQLQLTGYDGVASPIYKDRAVAMMLMGTAASIDFNEQDGRTNFAFRSQAGIVPLVTDDLTAQNLQANGYNFYGQYATAKSQFQFLFPGSVNGVFSWLDSYFNQIWLNANLQLAAITLLQARKSIPYNFEGRAAIEAAYLDPILSAVNFGAIRSGVTLSQSQINDVNDAAGMIIDTILSTRGWFLQINDTAPSQRVVRGTPPCTLWYMDGGSVQQLELASVELQ